MKRPDPGWGCAAHHPWLQSVLATLLIGGGGAGLAAGCASPPSMQAEVLEAEQRALSYRLEQVRAAETAARQAVESKRRAMATATQLDRTSLEGRDPFLILRKELLTELISALLPAEALRDSFAFSFTRSELQFTPEGMQVDLLFSVRAEELKALADEAPTGRLRFRLAVQHDPASGQLLLQATPLSLTMDDRFYRTARLLQTRFPPARFAGVLPDLPLPVALVKEVQWATRRQTIQLRFQPEQLLILTDRVVIPFGLSLTEVPPQPADPTVETAPPARSPIPTGLTPN